MEILLVEDSRTAVRMVEGLLAEEVESNFVLSVTTTLAEAKTALACGPYDLILLDLTLPDSFGLNTVDEIVSAAPHTPIVVLTSTTDEELGLQALKKGAQDFLVKDETYRKVLVRSVRYAYYRNKAEQEVREAKELAEFATLSKSSFIANLSHELRTPLNAIIGFSDMMLSRSHGEMNPKYEEYAGDINKSGQYLLGLIGTVLDMSKIEAQKIELHDEPIRPCDLIRDVISELQFHSEGAKQRIIYTPPNQIPNIRGDHTKLKQVFTNLISNGVKYSPDGGDVTVTVGLDDRGDFIARVADQGIGIPKEQIDDVVKPFQRTTTSVEKRIEGTGLGLSLSKGLIEAHGGDILVDSELGVGTTVTVLLPKHRVLDLAGV